MRAIEIASLIFSTVYLFFRALTSPKFSLFSPQRSYIVYYLFLDLRGASSYDRVYKKMSRGGKEMDRMRRIMEGRYGSDQLGVALLVAYLVLYLLSHIFDSGFLSMVSIAFLCWAVYRMFSRQLDRRRAENLRFLEAVTPLVRKYNVSKCRRQDKEHCYFKCPNCGQQLRVPKGKGKLSITCRNCGVSFEKKT